MIKQFWNEEKQFPIFHLHSLHLFKYQLYISCLLYDVIDPTYIICIVEYLYAQLSVCNP